MLKHLRFAVTAFSLTACVLLVALWVRSYKKFDQLYGHFKDNRIVTVNSIGGTKGTFYFVCKKQNVPFEPLVAVGLGLIAVWLRV